MCVHLPTLFLYARMYVLELGCMYMQTDFFMSTFSTAGLSGLEGV